MLEMKAVFEHKPAVFRTWDCQIESVIELSGKEFDEYHDEPLAVKDFIIENKDLMMEDDSGIYHCILVLGEERSDGILIEAEGYDYARYAAHIPHAREYIERELEQIAELFLKEITPNDDGSISVYLEDIEEYSGVDVRDDSDIARMFYRTLEKHYAVAEVDAIGDCIVITPVMSVHGRDTEATATAMLQRRNVILSKALDTLSEHYSGQELYDMLHECCGLTNEEITDEGFDLEDYFVSEQSEDGPLITM